MHLALKGASPLSSNWVGELVESKFACVLCQRVIVVARIRKSQQNVTGCIDHGEQHATWSTWSAASAADWACTGSFKMHLTSI